jgi:hypothetical protein
MEAPFDPSTKRSYQKRVALRKQLELQRSEQAQWSRTCTPTELTWSLAELPWLAGRCVLTLAMLLACGDVMRLSFDEKTFCFYVSTALQQGLSYSSYSTCVTTANQMLTPLFWVANLLAVVGKLLVVWRLAVSFFVNLGHQKQPSPH